MSGRLKKSPSPQLKNLLTHAAPLPNWLSHGETAPYGEGCPIFPSAPYRITVLNSSYGSKHLFFLSIKADRNADGGASVAETGSGVSCRSTDCGRNSTIHDRDNRKMVAACLAAELPRRHAMIRTTGASTLSLLICEDDCFVKMTAIPSRTVCV